MVETMSSRLYEVAVPSAALWLGHAF